MKRCSQKSSFYKGISELLDTSRQGYKPPVKSTGRGEKGFELGTEILKQGANLKLSRAERITDMIIEKKQEEVKNDSTICKK